MSTGKHTPVPWSCEREFTPEGTAAEAKGRGSVQIMANGFHIGTWIDTEWDGRCPNADFIVRAVNCHDDLVDALRAIRVLALPGATHIHRICDDAIAKAATNV